MANNELLIANLGSPADPNPLILHVQIKSSEKQVSAPAVGPQSFVQVSESNVGAPPWTLTIQETKFQLLVNSLPAIASVNRSLTTVLYPPTQ
jgi:hypothetical protein